MNHGLSDSSIDVLLQPANGDSLAEALVKVLCSKVNPLIDSNHDALISTLLLPHQADYEKPQNFSPAPKIVHTKHKIVWSEEGIEGYQNLLNKTLPDLQQGYCDVDTPEVASVLLQ